MRTAADLQLQIDDAIDKGERLILSGQYILDRPIVIRPIAINANPSICIEGNGKWNQIVTNFNGPAFQLYELKDSSFTNIGIQTNSGSGIYFESNESAGRCIFSGIRIQCKGIAFDFRAVRQSNGEDPDISCLTFMGCDVQGAVTGWRFTGPNNLNPTLVNCTASNCNVWLDFTQGGSDHLVYGGGTSGCTVGISVNPGYQGTVTGIVCEATETVLKLGSGTGSAYWLGVSDARNCPTLVNSGTNNGNLVVSALKCQNSRIVLTGNSGYLARLQKAALVPVTKPVGSSLVTEKLLCGFTPH